MKITSPGKTLFPRKCGRYSFRFRNPCIHDLHAVFLSSHVMNRCSSAVLQRPDSNSSQEKSPPFSGEALTNQQVSQISRSFGRYSLPRFSIRGTMVKLRGLFKGLAPGHGIMHGDGIRMSFSCRCIRIDSSKRNTHHSDDHSYRKY